MGRCINSYFGWPWPTFVTLTYTFLKDNFRSQDLGAGFLRDTFGACAPTLGLERIWAVHLIAEVPRLFPRTGDIFRTTYRFRDKVMQRSPLILGALRKFAIFRLPLQRRLVDFIFGSLVSLMEALRRSKLVWPLPTFVILTHIWSKNFQKAISRRLLQLQWCCRAQSYSSEWS